jgi:AraC-like DNA-binding protein
MDRPRVLASGNLGSPQRTIGGLLGQIEMVGLEPVEAKELLKRAGLPARAYDEPGFPISLQQDFQILRALAEHLPTERSLIGSLFLLIPQMRIQLFGIMGLAMQSAPTLLDALKVPLAYPEMNWGRCRMLLRESAGEAQLVYDIDPSILPGESENEKAYLREHSITLDMVGSIGLIRGIVSDLGLIRAVTLPFEQPPDWDQIRPTLSFPVDFSHNEAAIVLALGALQAIPDNAHRLSFNGAIKMVEREARFLADEVPVSERVSRWLWAYTPPLKKAEIARQIAMSERTLGRQLQKEGTSYNALLARVQCERAENLLNNRDLPISEIAFRLGYADPAAFTRAFVGWHGVPPSRWRHRGE